MEYRIVNVMGHVEVYDSQGQFLFSADTKAEAARQAIMAGLDVEASSDCFPEIPGLIADSILDPAVLDHAVSRVLLAKFKAGLFDDPFGERFRDKESMHSSRSIALAREIADESTVLLKNEGGLLPLDIDKLRSIAVLGPNADQVQFGDYSWSRNNQNGITPLAGITRLCGDRVKINYERGCDIMSKDTSGIAKAVEAARNSDIAIIFCGSASASLARDYSARTAGKDSTPPILTLPGRNRSLYARLPPQASRWYWFLSQARPIPSTGRKRIYRPYYCNGTQANAQANQLPT